MANKTYCSQCGGEFISSEAGFSHCNQHIGLVNMDELSPTVRKVMGEFRDGLEQRRAKEKKAREG